MADTDDTDDTGKTAMTGDAAPKDAVAESAVAEDAASEQPPRVVGRVNAALLPEPARALAVLMKRTGLKKVDVVNRALQIYDFLDECQQAGKSLEIRNPNGRGYTLTFM